MSEKIEYDAIVAICDANRGISLNNDLPWSIPDEYGYFMRVVHTTRDPNKMNAFVMGRLTWESAPLDMRPAQTGLNVIISNTMTEGDVRVRAGADPRLVIVHRSIDQALDDIRANYANRVETIYCLGGCEIFRESFRKIRRLYLSRISEITYECDGFLEPANFLDGFRKLSGDELVEMQQAYQVEYNTDIEAIDDKNGHERRVKIKLEVYERVDRS